MSTNFAVDALPVLDFSRHGASPGEDLKFLDKWGRAARDVFYHVANIGDARSLAIHPSTTTHSQRSPDDKLATGLTPGYVRLSVGMEHPDDIIRDLGQALDKALSEPALKEA